MRFLPYVAYAEGRADTKHRNKGQCQKVINALKTIIQGKARQSERMGGSCFRPAGARALRGARAQSGERPEKGSEWSPEETGSEHAGDGAEARSCRALKAMVRLKLDFILRAVRYRGENFKEGQVMICLCFKRPLWLP